MPKKQTRVRRRREPPGANLAPAAINLYHHIIDGAPITTATNELTDEDRRDANAMACAFIFIRRLIDDCVKEFKPEQYATSGIAQAYDLLDALSAGRDWPPFSRFHASLCLGGFRNSNAPPTSFENLRRSVLAGFVHAVQRATGASEKRAIDRVMEICVFPGVTFTANQISKWRTQSKDRDGKGPALTGEVIFETATKMASESGKSIPECVEEVGVYWVRGFWTVPHIS